MNKVFKHNLLLITFSIPFLYSGCKKDKEGVPNVYVDVYLYATDPAFSPLNSSSGFAYVAGGSKGIIVFRKSLSPPEFMAYDRHCTYKVPDGNSVTVNTSGLIAEDSKCSSKFLLTDGSVNQGPAISPLKPYQTAWDPTQGVLHIFN